MDLLYLAPFSKIGRINVSAPAMVPPEVIFGSQPGQDWCYYYQKITLARQQEDWSEAARLADEAAQKKLRFAILAIARTVLFITSISWGFYDLAVLLFVLGVVGWVLVWYMLTRHGRRRSSD